MNRDLNMIHRLLDGKVPETEKEDFLNRVNSDPFLKKEFGELQKAVGLVKGSEKVSAPLHFTSSVMRKLPVPPKSPKTIVLDLLFKSRILRWNMATALTAVCLTLVILGGALQFSKNYHPLSHTGISSGSDAMVQLTFYAPGAQKVAVAGDFNKWKIDDRILRKQSNGHWVAEIHLSPGAYNYMFVVDGENWVADPNAELYDDDGFGYKNSVLRVAQL